jgi:hypothetical protein
MGVEVTGAGVNSEKLLIDISESWAGFHMATSGNPQGQPSDWRSQFPQEQNNANQLFPSISGAIGGIGYDVNSGTITHTWTSIAANTTLTGQTGNGFFGVPLFQRFALAESIPVSVLPRPFRRFRVDYLVQGLVGPNAAADAACGIAGNNASGLITGGAADPFVAWVSRNALNGGRWTPRWRLTFGGAFVDGPDSGSAFIQAPQRWTQLSVQYDEGLIPRIRWLLDNREVHQLAGDANMPAATIYFLAKAMGNNAGGTSIKYATSRFRAWEIG